MFKKLLLAVISGSLIFAACGSTPPAQPVDSAPAAETPGDAPADTPAEGEVSSTSTAPTISVGMVTDIGGVNDLSFNQSAWEGLLRAQVELGASVQVLESRTDADYIPNMEALIDAGVDLVIGVGFRIADDIKQMAELFPDTKFAIVDSAFETEDVPNDNLVGILFRANEASFLVGLVAGKMTESNIVGFVNGMDSQIMNEFGVGFYSGVLTANPDATVLGQFVNSFGDPATGKAIALQMYSDGADIIFQAAGDSGNGVIEAARERDRWVIGVDMDQYHLAPDHMLTSAMKRVDIATFEIVNDVLNGTFLGNGTVMHDMVTGGVGLAPSSDVHVPADILAEVLEAQERIISGEIIVPNTIEEFQEMFPGVSYMGR